MSESHRTDSSEKAKQNEYRFYKTLTKKNALLAEKYDKEGKHISDKSGGNNS